MTLATHPQFGFDALSFYWRMHARVEGDNAEIPRFLPFEFDVISQLGLIIQKRDPLILDWLRRVYCEDANVGYLQEGHALSQAYGGDFLSFIHRTCEGRSVRAATEIGCGGGYILRQLAQYGIKVTGIDPSPVAARALERQGISCIQTFYPGSEKLPDADLIFHYDVLEHVEDPVGFLNGHVKHLSKGGLVIVAVPDCSASIALGDVSMTIHEHLNFFDRESLVLTMQAAGLNPLAIERSGHGAVLYCAAEYAGEAARPRAPASENKYERFVSTTSAVLERVGAYLQPLISDKNRSVGFYVPIRAIPYLCHLHIHSGVRFFDDDPGIHGKYFSGLPVPVENPENLAAQPVTDLIIMSLAFGGGIEARLKMQLSTMPEIYTLGRFLESKP